MNIKDGSLELKLDALDFLNRSARVLANAVLILQEALEEFKLGHEHKPREPHIRIMGDFYGWCDHCQTKVNWGPGEAEQALAKVEDLLK